VTSKTKQAKTLLLDARESEGNSDSDALDARVASATGLSSATVKNAV